VVLDSVQTCSLIKETDVLPDVLCDRRMRVEAVAPPTGAGRRGVVARRAAWIGARDGGLAGLTGLTGYVRSPTVVSHFVSSSISASACKAGLLCPVRLPAKPDPRDPGVVIEGVVIQCSVFSTCTEVL